MIPENKITKWHNCYDDGWKDLIVPEAFSHPAKMSYALLKRILAHAKGWLNEGDVIVDPFGGIGSTGILGAYEGYQVVCVELERKFVDLAIDNFVLHENAWEKLGCPLPIMIQGDSRRLCELVEKADCIMSSPPYERSLDDGHPSNKRTDGTEFSYSRNPANLGAMKPGKVDMVVSSPPYADVVKTGEGPGAKIWSEEKGHWIADPNTQGKYGNASGNLGNLKSGDVDCVISSPPYEGSEVCGVDQNKVVRSDKKYNYGKSNGQIGAQRGDIFWQAAKTIVQQCHQILKPGGHAIWVVKSFVRNKKIVDFPGDWQRLCESVGFKVVCIHHAMLVKETEHKTLFGDTETKRKERKSFFRRLAESKGSPRIDYEVVLCMERPDGSI